MEYFFIVGCQRSGTTMVQQALNRHSQVMIPPETGFFTHVLGHTRLGQASQLRSINSDLGIHLPEPQRRIHRTHDVRRYFDELAHQYRETDAQKSVRLFGEKTPHHVLRIRRIARHFPGSKTILVYRDGRDVALSLTKVPWFSDDLLVCFEHWLRCCRHHQWALRTASLQVHCVKYETFVDQPETQIRSICSFLGIEPEPAMSKPDGRVIGVAHSDREWMARAGSEIVPSRVGNWRKELTLRQSMDLEHWGGRVLRQLGYEVETVSSPGATLRVLARGHIKTAFWRFGNALQVVRRDVLGSE